MTDILTPETFAAVKAAMEKGYVFTIPGDIVRHPETDERLMADAITLLTEALRAAKRAVDVYMGLRAGNFADVMTLLNALAQMDATLEPVAAWLEEPK